MVAARVLPKVRNSIHGNRTMEKTSKSRLFKFQKRLAFSGAQIVVDALTLGLGNEVQDTFFLAEFPLAERKILFFPDRTAAGAAIDTKIIDFDLGGGFGLGTQDPPVHHLYVALAIMAMDALGVFGGFHRLLLRFSKPEVRRK
jgi:hypothetical protein